MSDTIAPPASSTVQQVRIVDAGPPKAPPPPTRELRASDIASLPGDSRKPAGEETSRQSLRRNLESKAKPGGDPTVTPTPVKDPPKEEKVAEEGEVVSENEENVSQTAKTAPKAEAGDAKKKANPWKLYDEEKKKRGEAEAEVQRLKTSIAPEQDRNALTERATKAEARAKLLEDEMRFVSYEKSKEFLDTYQAPYEAAWKRATTELSEIAITDPVTNQPRAVTSQDILELVNLPLGKAREIADEVFGKFADDVMAHRKEIRGLFEKQNTALEEARKNGSTREQQRREQYQKQHAETSDFVQKHWKEATDSFLNDPVNGAYFKPKVAPEGQQLTPEEAEWNEALARGEKFVDEAWKSNVMAPGLKPEERAAIIKKNAAVRLRAAAFGPLKRLNKRLEAKVAALEKDLKQYSESTPGAGGSTPNGKVDHTGSAKEGLFAALRKRAH
jgi:hypothetical protein